MKAALALVWLCVVALAGGYLALRATDGIALQSNILALLPRDARDVAAQGAQDRIADMLSRRVVFLVGSSSPRTAASAAARLSESLSQSHMVKAVTSGVDPSALQRIGKAYFPYRAGLLAPADRAALMDGKGASLIPRALSALYGPASFADARLIGQDPFLLLPRFLLSLPTPQSHLKADNGVLSVRAGGLTYVLVSAELSGDPYALTFENAFDAALAKTLSSLKADAPDLVVLRTGAVFYAHDGATDAMNETSAIGAASLIGTLGLILLVFGGLRPIVLGFAAIAIGILFGFVTTLLAFGQIHLIALLFGVSLIGISVDYSLQYFCEYFDTEAHNPAQRLKRVLPGIAIGVATTLIGYCTLLLAPFPGLRQVAVFSFAGLTATVLTVALWYPLLDSKTKQERRFGLVTLADGHWRFWESPSLRWARLAMMLALGATALAGSLRLQTNDDVRHLQSLSPDLKRQESEVERLTGASVGTEFLLVRGPDEEAVLETEERATDVLARDRKAGVLEGYSAISQFVPSIARQKSNRALVRDRLLSPYLANFTQSIGYTGSVNTGQSASFLKRSDLPWVGPLAPLQALEISSRDAPAHVVLLDGVKNAPALAASLSGISDVRVVNPVDDWTRLFADYRRDAIALLAISAALMYPLLAWRYGLRRGVRILMPSLAAVALTPSLAALAHVDFTFFNAMALVLVLSIGVDYSVFCAETSGKRKPVTALAIALAAASTILSFGLLAFSQVFAVHAFGMTMLIGICLAFLFAPAAGDASAREART